jgi:predicted DNA-binding transcriptional regulator YafY
MVVATEASAANNWRNRSPDEAMVVKLVLLIRWFKKLSFRYCEH